MKKVLIAISILLLSVSAFGSSVKDFGAVGDGKTDDTKAFNDALAAAAKEGGGVVSVPAGKYRINGNIKIPGSVTLEGTWRGAPLITDKNEGSLLLAYAGKNDPEGEPFIEFTGGGSALAGIAVYYPECDTKTIPPTPYPPCVSAKRGCDNITVRDCLLQNPYEGIKFVGAARHLISNVHGYPTHRGIFIDECYDISRIENVHLWPYGVAYSYGDPYCKYINRNAVAFEIAKSDWQYITNCFCYGYGVGFKFSDYGHGGCNASCLSAGADACKTAYLVEALRQPGLYITNSNICAAWESDCVGLEIKPTVREKVSLVNCGFWGSVNTHIKMDAPEGILSVSETNFASWGAFDPNAPAIDITAGKSMIRGCTFDAGLVGVKIGKDAGETVVRDNFIKGPRSLKIVNESKYLTACDNGVDRENIDPKNYTVEAGANDVYRVFNMYNAEDGSSRWGEGRKRRWTRGGEGYLLLPVKKGKKYEISLDIDTNEHGLDGGIYFGGTCLAELKMGSETYKFTLKPETDEIRLDIKCKSWRPCDVIPGYGDARTLGVGFSKAEVKIFK
ncbi:MAG: hypothetical protein J6332_09105 [Abditibacteriota bacterium]|nr:hypothetical protein [Abditibacteriota bacterium]